MAANHWQTRSAKPYHFPGSSTGESERGTYYHEMEGKGQCADGHVS